MVFHSQFLTGLRNGETGRTARGPSIGTCQVTVSMALLSFSKALSTSFSVTWVDFTHLANWETKHPTSGKNNPDVNLTK